MFSKAWFLIIYLNLSDFYPFAQASGGFVQRSQAEHRSKHQQPQQRRRDPEQPYRGKDDLPGGHLTKSHHFQQLGFVKLPVWDAHVLQAPPRQQAGLQTRNPPQPRQGPAGQLDR